SCPWPDRSSRALPRPQNTPPRSMTRTALPSDRGGVRGATIVNSTLRPIAVWRRSATRRRSVAISRCSRLNPPQRATSSGAGSTWTSRPPRRPLARVPEPVRPKRGPDRLEQCRAAQLVELERAIHRHVRRGALPVAQQEEHRDLAEVRRGLERADDVDAGDAGAWQVRVDEDHADIVVVTNRAQDLEARADR